MADLHLLKISDLKQGNYPGSELKIEELLEEKEGFKTFIASYLSEGLKIYGLLMVPNGEGTHPAIVFNHGYLPLHQFQTQRQYARYMEYLAKAGYVVFKSDYRGHGSSEGEAESLFEAGFAIDVLNSVASLKTLPQVDTENLGIWGHSMGGDVSLKVLEAAPQEFKAASIWAPPAKPYNELAKRWANQKPRTDVPEEEQKRRAEQRQKTVEALGDPDKDVQNYQAISPSANLQFIQTPIQIQHVKQDASIPYQDAEYLYEELQKLGKEVEINLIEEGDHNFSGTELEGAMQKTIEFYDKYLKVSS